jgi:hypothetical protein
MFKNPLEPRNNTYNKSGSSRKIISILIQARQQLATTASSPVDFGHSWEDAAVTSFVQFDN